MSLLDDFKLWRIVRRRQEIQRFEQVHDELGDGVGKKGLWTKSFAEADGQIEKAVAKYIERRVADIKDEEEITWQVLERSKATLPSSSPAPQLSAPSSQVTTVRESKSIYAEEPSDRWAVMGLMIGGGGLSAVVILSATDVISSPSVRLVLLVLVVSGAFVPALLYRLRRKRALRLQNKKYEAFANRHKNKKAG